MEVEGVEKYQQRKGAFGKCTKSFGKHWKLLFSCFYPKKISILQIKRKFESIKINKNNKQEKQQQQKTALS